LECEQTSRTQPWRVNQKDWYRFLLHRLTSEISGTVSILRNDVTFVTFNYDVSLDQYLYDRLNSIEIIPDGEGAKFMDSNRILHIYGSIRSPPNQKSTAVSFDHVGPPRRIRGSGCQSQ
jgi:hypothetical protein